MVFLIGLMLFATHELFVAAYVAIFVFMTARLMLTKSEVKIKAWLIIAYAVIVVLQIIMIYGLIFSEAAMYADWQLLRRVLAALALVLPMLVSRYIVAGKYAYFYLPSVEDVTTIGMAAVSEAATSLKHARDTANETRKKLRPSQLRAATNDLSKHSSFNYINNGSLTESYFEKVEEFMDDPNIYIVISRTGSPASELISVFTKQQYNHASLSFDRDMQTSISYNGGEKVYPPGLNMEMMEFFAKTPDSKILVYSLPCTREQKQIMLDQIIKINNEGSAYNILGLVLKRSYKPNIMFCSQFVYKMLDHAGLTYFTKPDGKVNPTDLIQLDYYRHLKFEKEITFHNAENGSENGN
ncbi:MAG: hypothetical protein FWB74_04785 [Defluviitaleaceae bacterium]|nr:hypothetical protein [Defluviitaleaceae bacterium]